MPPQLTNNDVARIAALARLAVDPNDAPEFARQLAAILDYAASIQQVDTTTVSPSGDGAPAGGRDDLRAPSLSRDTVLEQAPDAARDAGLFRVPKVL